jgi:AraC family transcriptional regulator
VHFALLYIPIPTLKAYAEQNDMPVFTGFPQAPTVGQQDPVMRRLAGAASAAFANRHRASGLVLDAILDAVCANVLGRHRAHQIFACRADADLPRWCAN